MGKAILSYTLNKKSNIDADELILLTGSLRAVDRNTKEYESLEAMRQSPEFQERINEFIKRNLKKKQLWIHYRNGVSKN